MKTENFELEIITPCFCGGAEPEQRAEIRAPSIRGQLRWWFRVLGGFKTLSSMPVQKQEALVFGSTSGEEGSAGKLVVRVSAPLGRSLSDSMDFLAPNMNEPQGYLLFPLRIQARKQSSLQCFSLRFQWRGELALWEDIRALVSIFGHLGSLGFRGRRAMGALAFKGPPPLSFSVVLSRFSHARSIVVKRLAASSARNAITQLANWLKSARAHGRSGQNQKEQASPYFKYAKIDHDIGYGKPASPDQTAFRPALGLPIIQKTRVATNNWDWRWNRTKRKGEGRFASPVLLRPHRDEHGTWHALVVFVDARQWPEEKRVYVNGKPCAVSLELYKAMKEDPRLTTFPI